MSEKVSKIILTEQQVHNMRQTQKVLDDIGAHSKENLGKLIMKDLLNEYKKNNGFTLGDDIEIGLNTQAAGCMSLLLLIVNFDYDISTNTEAQEILNNTLINIINYIEENGFDFSPFVPNKKTADIFRLRVEGTRQFEYYSIEALTWVLSCLIQARRAYIDKKIKLSDELNQKIIKWIGRCLRYIEDSASKVTWIEPVTINGVTRKEEICNTAAWGFINKSNYASIYYTTLVMETLSEFDDNIIVSDINLQDSLKPDIELLEALGAKRIKRRIKTKYGFEDRIVLENITKSKAIENPEYGVVTRIFSKVKDETKEKEGLIQRTSKWIWYTYNDQVKENKLVFDEQLRNDKIYTMIFILELMTITYTEDFLNNRKIVEDTIEAGIFYVDRRIKYLEANSTKFLQASTYKADYIGLLEDDEDDEDDKYNEYNSRLNRILNKSILIGPNLRPLRIKLGGLYAFFFTRYPDKKMSAELKTIFKDKSKDRFLWDVSEYNVFYTEKSIEAITDFFNYYEGFEEKYVELYEESEKVKHELEVRLEVTIREQVERAITADLHKKHQEEIQVLKERLANREEELLQGKLSIYSQLKSFINECFDEKFKQEEENKTTDLFKELSKAFKAVDYYNRYKDEKTSESIKNLAEIFNKASMSQSYLKIAQNRDEIIDNMSEYEQNYYSIMNQFFDYTVNNENEAKLNTLFETFIKQQIL